MSALSWLCYLAAILLLLFGPGADRSGVMGGRMPVDNATTQLPPHDPHSHNHTKPVSRVCVDKNNNYVLAESPKDESKT